MTVHVNPDGTWYLLINGYVVASGTGDPPIRAPERTGGPDHAT